MVVKVQQYPVKPSDDELAQRWVKMYPNTTYAAGKYRRYSGGYWPELPEFEVKQEILWILKQAKAEGIRPTQNLLSSVHVIARTWISVKAEDWDADEDILVLENGTLRISALGLRDHDPDDLVTYSLPFAYDPSARSESLHLLLSRFPEDVQLLLQEFTGYSLTSDMRFEYALWLVGEPGGGKSTIISIIETVAGNRCTNLSFANLSRSQFALTNLPGKTVALATEQPADFRGMTHILNSLISGERITVERKFCDPYDFFPKAKLVWASNEKPHNISANDGLMRRLLIIEVPSLPVDERDPDLKDRIRNEGPGILNWAIEGLKNLRKRGYFLIPQSVAQAGMEYKRSVDTPALFLEDVYVRDIDGTIPAQEHYDRYRTWCLANGYEPKSNVRVADDWKRLGLVRFESNGRRFWNGVRLKSTL